MTSAAGLPAYEVSNHARPGEESRHNLTYWRYGDYLGIGPGAHGRRAGVATVRAKKPENWLGRIDAQTNGIAEQEQLDPATQATEALLMGLRLEEGVSLARCEAAIDPAAMDRLIVQGLLEREGDRLRVTEGNMLVLDGILGAIAR
jgi:oxygen-independent coproporphyrinogen-3 oxidase